MIQMWVYENIHFNYNQYVQKIIRRENFDKYAYVQL